MAIERTLSIIKPDATAKGVIGPIIARFEEEGTISLQGGSFTRLVQQTAFAAAREPGRYAMHGVLAELEDDALKLVATDGRRLAVASVPVDGAKAGGSPAVVPTRFPATVIVAPANHHLL